MAAKGKGYTGPSREEMQAMRAQKGVPQVGPVFEATRRAERIRDGLDRLNVLTETMIEAFQAGDWKTLGYASFTAYTKAEFDSRLNLQPEQRVLMASAFMRAGLSKRAAAAAMGVHESTVRQDLKDAGNPAPSRKAPQVKGHVVDGEVVETSAGDIPPAPVDGAGSDPGEESDPVSNLIDEEDSPTPVADGASPDPDASGQESGASSPTDPSVASQRVLMVGDPAGQPLTSDTSEGSLEVATGQPGQDLSPEDSGDADSPSSSSLPDPLGTAEPGSDGEEGPAIPPQGPSFTDPESLVQHLEQFVTGLEGVDIDVLGPLFTEDQLSRAHRAADAVAWLVGMLTTWSEKS